MIANTMAKRNMMGEPPRVASSTEVKLATVQVRGVEHRCRDSTHGPVRQSVTSPRRRCPRRPAEPGHQPRTPGWKTPGSLLVSRLGRPDLRGEAGRDRCD